MNIEFADSVRIELRRLRITLSERGLWRELPAK